MAVDASKFQVILFGLNSSENIVLEAGGCSIGVANSVTLLGITIDSKVNCYEHVSKFCQKATTKISALLGSQSSLMRNNNVPSTTHL